MKKRLFVEDCAKLGDRYYFASINYNLLFSVDESLSNLALEDCFPEEDFFAQRLSSKILIWDDCLIFVPMNSDKLWIWNNNIREWKGYRVPTLGMNRDKFFQAYIKDDTLYMFGCSVPAIVVFDLHNGNFRVIDEAFKSISTKKRYLEEACFRKNYIKIDNEIFMASCLDNSVMIFNLLDESVRLVKVGRDENKYSGIVFDGEKFWISSTNEYKVVVWDGQNEVIEYTCPPHDRGFVRPNGIYAIDPCTMFIPSRAGKSVLLKRMDEGLEWIFRDEKYRFVSTDDSGLISCEVDGTLQKTVGNSSISTVLEIDSEDIKNFACLNEHLDFAPVMHENDLIGIKEFISIT